MRIKKIAALLLFVFIMQTAWLPANAAEDMTEADTTYENTVLLLQKLGIIDTFYSSFYGPDSVVSVGAAELAAAGINKSAAVDFGSESDCSTAEACAILLKALGLHSMMNAEKLEAADFLNMASKEGILKGVSLSADGKLRSGQFVKMLKNSLEIEQKTAYRLNDGDHFVDCGTYFSRNKISKGKGIVTATEDTALDFASGTSPDTVRIENEEYDSSEFNMRSMLGYSVEYYVQDTGGSEKIICALPEAKNKTVTISSKDIKKATTSEIKYYTEDGKKVKTANLSKDFSLIYNGKHRNQKSAAYLSPSVGTVTLIDNGGSGYSVVTVWDYDVYVISNVNKDIINDENGKAPIDASDSDYVKIYKNGAETTTDRLKENDIAYVANDATEKYFNIFVSNKTVKGCVTAVERYDSQYNYYYIDGEKYLASAALPDNGLIGSEGTFYLSIMNIIEKQSITYNSEMYGLLVSIGGESVPEEVQLKIFDENGSVNIYSLDEKAYLYDGTQRKIGDSEIAILKDYAKSCVNAAAPSQGGGMSPPVIMYTLSKDKVKTISIPTSFDPLNFGENRGKYTLQSVASDPGMIDKQSYNLFRPDGGFYPSLDANLNDGSYKFLGRDTVIFEVPATESGVIEPGYENNSFAYKGSNHRFVNWTYGSFYNMNDDRTVGVMCYCVRPDNGTAYQNGIVISDVKYVLDADDTVRMQISGYEKSGFVTYTLAEKVIVSKSRIAPLLDDVPALSAADLKRGDYIMVCRNGKNEISYIEPVILADIGKNSYNRVHNERNHDQDGEMLYGTVSAINGNMLEVQLDKNMYDGSAFFAS